MSGEGHDGIDAMIAAAQQQFPGHRFELVDGPDSHHDRVRFTWQLVGDGGARVAVGFDFGTLAPDGRLRSVTGFLAAERPARADGAPRSAERRQACRMRWRAAA